MYKGFPLVRNSHLRNFPYKGLHFVKDFPLEGIFLFTGLPLLRDFPLQGVSMYKGNISQSVFSSPGLCLARGSEEAEHLSFRWAVREM